VNDRGELVGINTAILSRAGGNQGIGFAIPTNLTRQVLDQILKHGKVTRAYLGIMPQDVSPTIAKAFGAQENRGALVGDVTPDSPAARAGIEKGDIIITLNGKPVNDSNQLRLNISMMAPDSSASVKLLRKGAERDVTVKLAEYPSNEQRAKLEEGEPSGALEGVTVEDLNAGIRRELNLPAGAVGVVVTEVSPSSSAAAAGLRPGDVIQEVNRQAVRSAADFERALSKAGSNPLLLVNRRGNTLFLAV
jgi:serine protease Do